MRLFGEVILSSFHSNKTADKFMRRHHENCGLWMQGNKPGPQAVFYYYRGTDQHYQSGRLLPKLAQGASAPAIEAGADKQSGCNGRKAS